LRELIQTRRLPASANRTSRVGCGQQHYLSTATRLSWSTGHSRSFKGGHSPRALSQPQLSARSAPPAEITAVNSIFRIPNCFHSRLHSSQSGFDFRLSGTPCIHRKNNYSSCAS
jgi:hypothetical protein